MEIKMGLFSSVGKIFNDVTGASSAAKYNTQMTREQMKNAHQWEVEDLKKAGLNPILSAGGSTAGAIASGSSGMQAGGIGGLSDIMNSAAGIAKTMSDMDLQTSQQAVNDSTISKNNTETAGIAAENKWIDKKEAQAIEESQTRAGLNSAKAAESAAAKDKIIADQELAETEKEIKKGGLITKTIGTDPINSFKNLIHSAKRNN